MGKKKFLYESRNANSRTKQSLQQKGAWTLKGYNKSRLSIFNKRFEPSDISFYFILFHFMWNSES